MEFDKLILLYSLEKKTSRGLLERSSGKHSEEIMEESLKKKLWSDFWRHPLGTLLTETFLETLQKFTRIWQKKNKNYTKEVCKSQPKSAYISED